MKEVNKVLLSAMIGILAAMPAWTGTIQQYGPTSPAFTGWPVVWTPLPSLNDGVGGAYSQLDFVGDALDPAAYWASSTDYFFFRMRTAFAGAVGSNTYQDTLFLYIDRVGWGNEGGFPDYGFAWDSKAQNHGLEMLLPPDIRPSNWNSLNMNDIDGDIGLKLFDGDSKLKPPAVGDINRTGDGYVRTIDGVSTTNFGATTFVDFAVSWSYLTSHTSLAPDQTWRFALASVNAQTDHQSPTVDVAGGATVSGPLTSGWSAQSDGGEPVPEPGTLGLVFGSVAIAVFWKNGRVRASCKKHASK